jgi:hypothetical protein
MRKIACGKRGSEWAIRNCVVAEVGCNAEGSMWEDGQCSVRKEAY